MRLYSEQLVRTSEANINSTRVIIYETALQEVCEKFNDVEAFIKKRIEKLCNEKMLSAEEVIYWIYNDYNNS